ncbi:MAG: class I SAM-dependent methyltransferase [Pseudomonadota bacterium]
MIASLFVRRSLLTLLLALLATSVSAQAQKPFEPQVGQEGKDVIWVPTPQALVEKMMDLAKVTSSDYVIDLGSGDGRTVITAAKRGARALGIEYNPDMVELSKRNAIKEGVTGKANFVKADIFESDFSQATVITMYLLPQLNVKLRPKILDLKPGTRIVSHAFTMEEWTADQTDSFESRTAYLWIVPAKVEGTWQLPKGELALKQSFQMLAGTLKTGGNTLTIDNGKLRGDQISFSAGNAEYAGRVNGNTIQGTVKGSNSGSWTATRVGAR